MVVVARLALPGKAETERQSSCWLLEGIDKHVFCRLKKVFDKYDKVQVRFELVICIFKSIGMKKRAMLLLEMFSK